METRFTPLRPVFAERNLPGLETVGSMQYISWKMEPATEQLNSAILPRLFSRCYCGGRNQPPGSGWDGTLSADREKGQQPSWLRPDMPVPRTRPSPLKHLVFLPAAIGAPARDGRVPIEGQRGQATRKSTFRMELRHWMAKPTMPGRPKLGGLRRGIAMLRMSWLRRANQQRLGTFQDVLQGTQGPLV